MLNPWFFGLEAVQLGWRAQSELALKLMRTFAGGAPTQTSPNSGPLAVDLNSQGDIKKEEVSRASARETHAAIDEGQETPVVIADLRRRKASKILPVAKKKSHVKAQGSKRAASASQKSATKVRRSARKKR
jgi:hypothetical protein